MVPVGQHYEPTGRLEARSLAILLILGTFTAVFAAFVMWLWEISPIPQIVLVSPALQGLLIGGVLAFIVRRLQVRNVWLVWAIGLLCGALSVVLVHYGHYRIMMHQSDVQIRSEILADKELPQAAKATLLDELAKHPGMYLDQFLQAETGQAGFLGSMQLRAKEGFSIGHIPLTGLGVWGMWLLEALFVVGIAGAPGAVKAAEAFCEDCSDWCSNQSDVVVMPGGLAQDFATALREDNPAQANALRTQAPQNPAEGMACVSLDQCPHCDQTFASLALRVVKGRDSVATTWILKKLRISPEMAKTLRTPPTPAPSTEPAPEPEPA